MTHAVTGWGYEGHTIEDLLDECERLRAAYVVDIRLNAISRKKGFSKTALSNALAGAGVEYVHLRPSRHTRGRARAQALQRGSP